MNYQPERIYQTFSHILIPTYLLSELNLINLMTEAEKLANSLWIATNFESSIGRTWPVKP